MRIIANPHFLSSLIPRVRSPNPISKPFSAFHFLPYLFPAMASENLSTSPSDDDKYGFRRSEMYQSNLAGTVGDYDRHVFLCYKSPDSWAPIVENSDLDPLPKLLSSALKARKDDLIVKTRLTICEGREGTNFSDGDVLIFPEMIKYRGLKESDIDSFFEDVLMKGKPWESGVQEVLSGSHVFVCSHGSRDKRCGVCGPALIQKLNEEIELRGLKDQVFVSPCSHIGGHKYAGNLIIYSPGPDGKIMGHWYGYVTPDDVPELLDLHIAKGEIIERLWRGQMGAPAEDKRPEQHLPNREDVNTKNNLPENKQEISAGCCQGANGFSCCQDGTEKTKLKEALEENKEGVLNKLSGWIGTWEQSEVLTATAVVGAVATIAVAYSLYKRSG